MVFSGFMQKTSAHRGAAICRPAARLQIDVATIEESGCPRSRKIGGQCEQRPDQAV
jgi:hypothetical protein